MKKEMVVLCYVTPSTALHLEKSGAAVVVDAFEVDPANATNRVKYWLRDPERMPKELTATALRRALNRVLDWAMAKVKK